ncbi:MAG: hypothetical protein JOZ41_15940, partial [Chloroflexi bacterium]|nr:hypothetical protein [Chloroflexota bacterium]
MRTNVGVAVLLVLAAGLIPFDVTAGAPGLQRVTCPAHDTCSLSLGVGLRLPPTWLVMPDGKEGPYTIAFARRPVVGPDYDERLIVKLAAVRNGLNDRRLAEEEARRLVADVHARGVSLVTVRYGGSPGFLLRGLPPTPAPATEIVVAHRGDVYLLIAPGKALAVDQQRALASVVFFPPQGARPPVGAPRVLANAPHQPLETVDISFLTPSLGWRLAVGWDQIRGLHGPLLVSRTADGGLTWRTIGTAPGGMIRQAGGEVFRVSSIVFASPRDGWAYGAALYATHDAGRAWARVPILGNSTSLSVAGRSVWRLDTRCRNATCRAILLSSTAAGDRWTRSRWQPPASWTTGASLARADASHAWLLSGELSAPPNHVTRLLLGTTDGGETWRALPL